MRSRGFTLIELMIVVAIIGLLAAIAIPNFGKFQCKTKQTEAKTNLKLIQVGEEAYRAENDHFAIAASADLNIISVVIKGRVRYSYSVVGGPSDPSGVTAVTSTAVGLPEFFTAGSEQWDLELTSDTSSVTNILDGCNSF